MTRSYTIPAEIINVPEGYSCTHKRRYSNCNMCRNGIVAISWHELEGKCPEWKIATVKGTGSTGPR